MTQGSHGKKKNVPVFPIPETAYEKFSQLAKDEGKTFSQAIRDAMKEYASNRGVEAEFDVGTWGGFRPRERDPRVQRYIRLATRWRSHVSAQIHTHKRHSEHVPSKLLIEAELWAATATQLDSIYPYTDAGLDHLVEHLDTIASDAVKYKGTFLPDDPDEELRQEISGRVAELAARDLRKTRAIKDEPEE